MLMANPIIPGIPEAEQGLLYQKLNEYNRGRTSYKDAACIIRNMKTLTRRWRWKEKHTPAS
jgi:hypothetical protein